MTKIAAYDVALSQIAAYCVAPNGVWCHKLQLMMWLQMVYGDTNCSSICGSKWYMMTQIAAHGVAPYGV